VLLLVEDRAEAEQQRRVGGLRHRGRRGRRRGGGEVAAEKEEAVAGTGRHRMASVVGDPTKGEAVRRFSDFSLRARENGAAAGWAQCRARCDRASGIWAVGSCFDVKRTAACGSWAYGPCARMGLICALWVTGPWLANAFLYDLAHGGGEKLHHFT
jgi:hypothetical protein